MLPETSRIRAVSGRQSNVFLLMTSTSVSGDYYI